MVTLNLKMKAANDCHMEISTHKDGGGVHLHQPFDGVWDAQGLRKLRRLSSRAQRTYWRRSGDLSNVADCVSRRRSSSFTQELHQLVARDEFREAPGEGTPRHSRQMFKSSYHLICRRSAPGHNDTVPSSSSHLQ